MPQKYSLETFSFRFLWIFLGLSVCACQASNRSTEPFEYLTEARTSSHHLKLTRAQDKCAVQLDDQEPRILGIDYPCGFVRQDDESPAQSEYYEQAGRVFVSAGPIADDLDYPADAGVNPEHRCSNMGVALILTDGELELRDPKNIELGFCHHLGFDEKVFYGYAFPVE
jgi:hypothetical protein